MHGHLSDPPNLANVPSEERPIVARALAKKPEERWPSCRAFIDALAEVAYNQQPFPPSGTPQLTSGLPPISTVSELRSEPKATPTQKLTGRAWLTITALCGLVLLLLLLLVAWWTQSPTPPSEFTNSLGMKLKLIPAGKFLMGSPANEPGRSNDETQHDVEITQPFYLGIHTVTVGQFRAFVQAKGYQTEAERDGTGGYGYDPAIKHVTGRNKKYTWKNPGWKQGDDEPVVNVTWDDAMAFCDWLTAVEGKKHRLPTEAEWEYSCRAGTKTQFSSGKTIESLKDVANIADSSFKEKWPTATWAVSWNDGYAFTAPVGSFKPNDFGLYDMHGNVWQWCSDWYQASYYQDTPKQDPQGPAAGPIHVSRGGSHSDGPGYCRAACRHSFWNNGRPDDRGSSLGFRVLRVR
jgi:formylglycine-generating enzyme required for sulfatase activity